MRMKKFGKTGAVVSELCLGTMTFGWQADEEGVAFINGTSSISGLLALSLHDSRRILNASLSAWKSHRSHYER